MSHLEEYYKEKEHYAYLCKIFNEKPKLDRHDEPDPSCAHYQELKEREVIKS